MSATISQAVSVSLSVSRFTFRPTRIAQVRCTDCHTPLTVHQPDEGQPSRLLGTCSGCGHWYLMDCAQGHDESVMAQLPDGDSLRDVAAS
jgi:hypothetical protein